MGKNHSKPSLENLEDNKPIDVKKMISITVDQNGKYVGFPEEWVKQYGLDLIVDQAKTVKTRDMPEEVRATELPESIIELINQKSI